LKSRYRDVFEKRRRQIIAASAPINIVAILDDIVIDASVSLGRYFDFYNSERPHSSLGGLIPVGLCHPYMGPHQHYQTAIGRRSTNSEDSVQTIPAGSGIGSKPQ
jgi:hypothetical protein